NRGWSGYIVTNGNCSAIHLVLTLKPLQDAFGLDACVRATLQAVSGAGEPGVPSLDMIDNVVPFINTEEEKLAEEARKFLGVYDGEFRPADLVVSATCTRVPVRDGHTESAAVRLKRSATPAEVIDAFRSFRSKPQEMQLPSAPCDPVIVRTEN